MKLKSLFCLMTLSMFSTIIYARTKPTLTSTQQAALQAQIKANTTTTHTNQITGATTSNATGTPTHTNKAGGSTAKSGSTVTHTNKFGGATTNASGTPVHTQTQDNAKNAAQKHLTNNDAYAYITVDGHSKTKGDTTGSTDTTGIQVEVSRPRKTKSLDITPSGTWKSRSATVTFDTSRDRTALGLTDNKSITTTVTD